MPEFDRANYPESLGCKVMPAIEPDSVDVEVADAENNLNIYEVPAEAVTRMNIKQG